MMNLAVVGTGNIVRKFLYAISKTEGMRCVAVCSRSREKAEQFIESCESLAADAVRIYVDYDKLLADPDIELVYVALPNSLHYPYSKRALEAGKHVICEKPFTVELTEAEELAELAKKGHLFLFEAITTRDLPNYAIIKEYLPSVGKVRMVQCNFSQYSSRYEEYLAGETPNVFHPDFAGGALNDLNVYNLHFVAGLFGRPRKVSYYANEGRNGIDLSGVAVLSYDGFQAVCVAAKDSASPNFVLIQGEKGYIRVNGQSSRCQQIEVWANGKLSTYGVEQTEENVLVYEVLAFEKMIQAEDFGECYRRLDESLLTQEILVDVRASRYNFIPAGKSNNRCNGTVTNR